MKTSALILLLACGVAPCVSAQPASAPGRERSAAKKASPATARPGGAPASFQVRAFESGDRTLRYSLFVPDGIKSGEKLPLVLCLHGAGGNTEAAKVLAAPERQAKERCIIMAPGTDRQTGPWVKSPLRASDERPVTTELLGALDAVMREFPVDPDRIYLTGQSMGGIGTWGLLALEPKRFAAAVPICGLWQPDDAAKMVRVPIWAFHGAKDPTVPVDGSRRMIAALKAAGATPRYTEYPDVAHNSWSPAYATEELWTWLFAQRRKAP